MTQRYRVEPAMGRRSRAIELRPIGAAAGDWVSLGRLAELGPSKDVRLDLSREHVVSIVGKRGSGKSFTLGSFLEGLCTTESTTPIGQLSKDRAALLFDTLNIFQFMTAPVSDSTD